MSDGVMDANDHSSDDGGRHQRLTRKKNMEDHI